MELNEAVSGEDNCEAMSLLIESFTLNARLTLHLECRVISVDNTYSTHSGRSLRLNGVVSGEDDLFNKERPLKNRIERSR